MPRDGEEREVGERAVRIKKGRRGLKAGARRQLKTTAYHEAGHAVIGRVLKLPLEDATIKPNYDEAEAGHSIIPDPYACLLEWQWGGHMPGGGLDTVFHARIMAYMAGAEVEMVLLGSRAEGDGDDRYQIALMAEQLDVDWDRLEPRLRAMTRMLVRRHRIFIDRVAKALLAKTSLSTKALDKLVGRSIADVRINAPHLLKMHRRRRPVKAT